MHLCHLLVASGRGSGLCQVEGGTNTPLGSFGSEWLSKESKHPQCLAAAPFCGLGRRVLLLG